ncbi:hypothetical protein CDAR_452851 [Caerostris darwini]|uniref:Uncharacterized protein n=1 Tax=Caerostris darwini TaxID=1538125 RepID=A0AAV4SM12_9ARAC|nr:hypothetical protein CDAR_452851 [Caerostris darwini]
MVVLRVEPCINCKSLEKDEFGFSATFWQKLTGVLRESKVSFSKPLSCLPKGAKKTGAQRNTSTQKKFVCSKFARALFRYKQFCPKIEWTTANVRPKKFVGFGGRSAPRTRHTKSSFEGEREKVFGAESPESCGGVSLSAGKLLVKGREVRLWSRADCRSMRRVGRLHFAAVGESETRTSDQSYARSNRQQRTQHALALHSGLFFREGRLVRITLATDFPPGRVTSSHILATQKSSNKVFFDRKNSFMYWNKVMNFDNDIVRSQLEGLSGLLSFCAKLMWTRVCAKHWSTLVLRPASLFSFEPEIPAGYPTGHSLEHWKGENVLFQCKLLNLDLMF